MSILLRNDFGTTVVVENIYYSVCYYYYYYYYYYSHLRRLTVTASFVLLSTPNRSAPNREVETSHASTRGLCLIVRVRERVCYKWVGWIRRVGGEVEVCE